MHRLTIDPPWNFAAWRTQARAALAADVPPEAIEWVEGSAPSLLASEPLPRPESGHSVRVPRHFAALAERLVMHVDPRRHALPYRILWRLMHGEPELLRRATDPDIHRAEAMTREIRRDLHKMKAFVRFRAVPGEDETYLAWFEPAHQIVDAIAPFFARRFAGMRWSILTPYRSAHWDGDALRFGDGATKADAPDDDALEALWRRYYAHIFNPARLNLAQMRKEMPQKYWKNLPEAQLIPELVRDAGARAQSMVESMPKAPSRKIAAPKPVAAPQPKDDSIEALRDAAAGCRNCELWQDATQTVFGEGPENARILVVGEQPGDEEDLRGRPFVGASGKLFDKAIDELGLDRDRFYVTNAVKHFRFDLRGKFRLHRSPSASHVRACHVWLERELATVKPDIVVCLGAIAAKAVFGNSFGLMAERGSWRTLPDGTRGFATVHPSWVLRQRGDAARAEAYRGFVEDLSLLRDA
jgi:uracil-DNA glycosylase